MIRITGGINRSRLLETPDTTLTKPTMDKVRLGVFSSLGNAISGANVLDLFAGSGSYGFESLSRGAACATFVEKSLPALKSLKINSENLKLTNVKIETRDCLLYLQECDKKYDVIFADPPYKLEVYEDIVRIILNRNLLSDKGIIVLETEKELNIDESLFSSIKFYKYGLAKVYILRR